MTRRWACASCCGARRLGSAPTSASTPATPTSPVRGPTPSSSRTLSLYLAGAYLAYLARYRGVQRTEEFAVRCYNGGPPHGATLPATGRYWSKYAEAKALVLQELCPPGVGAADGDVGEGGWHVVAPGDTLWGIARLHRTSVAALLRANPALAADPDRISPGTRVRLPPP